MKKNDDKDNKVDDKQDDAIVDDTTRKIDRKRKTETEKLLGDLYKPVFGKRKRQLKKLCDVWFPYNRNFKITFNDKKLYITTVFITCFVKQKRKTRKKKKYAFWAYKIYTTKIF